jgi:hypothetical protein
MYLSVRDVNGQPLNILLILRPLAIGRVWLIAVEVGSPSWVVSRGNRSTDIMVLIKPRLIIISQIFIGFVPLVITDGTPRIIKSTKFPSSKRRPINQDPQL